MNQLQRWGSLAAIYQAAAYIIGLLVFIVILDYPSITEPADKIGVVVGNPTMHVIAQLLLYVVFGITLVVLSLALYERLKGDTKTLAQVSTVFGLIWAGLLIGAGMVSIIGAMTVVDLYSNYPEQATVTWIAVDIVANGLGGQAEITGGMWTLLVSVAAMRGRNLPAVLNYLGIVVGLAGILSVVPALNEIGVGIFALTQIVWFVGVGIVLLRPSQISGERVQA